MSFEVNGAATAVPRLLGLRHAEPPLGDHRMGQEDAVKAENEAIKALIAKGRAGEAVERAIRNAEMAATQSDALEGNCAFTLGRAAHESGQHRLAVVAYTRALEKSTLLRNAHACASIHFSMATAFLEMSDGDRQQNLELAILNHLGALGMLTEASRPVDYASVQYNMGYAYAELASRFGKPVRNEARHCFENALQAFRRLGMPADARKAQDALRALDS